MTSLRKAEANRRNSQHSTGSRTMTGKSRSRLNSLRHGLYSTPAVLPGEDAAHRAIVEVIHQQYQPEGPIEAALVNQIVSAVVVLNRLGRAYDVHLAALIKQYAAECRCGNECRVSGAPLEISNVRSIEDVSNRPAERDGDVEAQHVDYALDELISNMREVRIAADFDRRKRHLIDGMEQALALLRDLQADRRAVVISPLPLALEERNNGHIGGDHKIKKCRPHIGQSGNCPTGGAPNGSTTRNTTERPHQAQPPI